MKKITRFLFCIFVAIMLMGTAISATACHQKGEYPSVPEVTEPQPTGEIIPTVDRQKELKDARKKYADAVAWLYMPGTEVDDPVVQAKDNAYYLQKDENGNYSEWGCYYAHCDNRLSSRSKLDRNTGCMTIQPWRGCNPFFYFESWNFRSRTSSAFWMTRNSTKPPLSQIRSSCWSCDRRGWDDSSPSPVKP